MASISVVGLGKLGAPLAAVLATSGHNVIGVDASKETIRTMGRFKAPIPEDGLQELLDQSHNNLSVTESYSKAVADSDVTFIIVPTPSKDDQPRFSTYSVESAVNQLGKALRQKSTWHLIVIVSTVMPGATEGDIKTALARALGEENMDRVGMCYSPEFIALGTVVQDMRHPDMILIGESDSRSGELLESILKSTTKNDPPVYRMPIVDAEIAKISINTYITMKISYANQLAEICEAIPGADARVVAEAVGADSRIGPKYITPATAYGGPCFPRDTKAFFALGLDAHMMAHLADVTERINDRQVTRLAIEIATRRKSENVGVLGLSYKAGTYVSECSAGVRLVHELRELGRTVFCYDPRAEKAVEQQSTTAEAVIEQSDTIVIMTAWPEFRNLPLGLFAGKTVYDCWAILPDEIHDVEIFRTGRHHK